MKLAHYLHSCNLPLPAQYAGRSIAQVEANWRIPSHAQDPPQVPDHDLSSCMYSLRGGVGSNIWLYEPGIILSLHLARSALKIPYGACVRSYKFPLHKFRCRYRHRYRHGTVYCYSQRCSYRSRYTKVGLTSLD